MGESKTKHAALRRASRPRMTVIMGLRPGIAVIRHGLSLNDAQSIHDTGTYNVTHLYEIANALPDRCGPILYTITQAELDEVAEGRPEEEWRYIRAIPLAVAQAQPLLSVIMPGGEYLFIDGRHRILRMAMAGIRSFKLWTVPPDLLPPPPWCEIRRIEDCTPEMLDPANVMTAEQVQRELADMDLEQDASPQVRGLPLLVTER